MTYSTMNYKMKKELQHHGIKGMRWGVRRQRGSDGRIIPGKYVTGNESSSSGRGDIGGQTSTKKSVKETMKETAVEIGKEVAARILLVIGVLAIVNVVIPLAAIALTKKAADNATVDPTDSDTITIDDYVER